MASYTVQLLFNDGVNSYTFPLMQMIDDPQPGMKATRIDGNRGSGAIIIPGGLEPVEINVEGILFDSDGYEDLTDKMADMRSKVSTNPATLTLRHWTGATWQNDWSYTVRRISAINFPRSNDLRTEVQPYRITFVVIGY